MAQQISIKKLHLLLILDNTVTPRVLADPNANPPLLQSWPNLLPERAVADDDERRVAAHGPEADHLDQLLREVPSTFLTSASDVEAVECTGNSSVRKGRLKGS